MQWQKLFLNVFKKKKINKFNLMGHSMGGMVVQEIVKIACDNINKRFHSARIAIIL